MDNHFHFMICRKQKMLLSAIEVSQCFQEFMSSECRIDARSIKILNEKENLNDMSHCMMRFRSSYAKDYNKKENRKGTLWNGPF